MTPVLRGSGVLCYVETRVLTRVEVTGIDGFMSYETASQPQSGKHADKPLRGFRQFTSTLLTMGLPPQTPPE
jgi:hypothetical protein